MTQLSLTLKREFAVPVSLRQLSEEYGNLAALVTYLDRQLPADKFAPVPSPAPPATAFVPAMSSNGNGSLTALDQIAQQLQVLTQQVQQLQSNGTAPWTMPAMPPPPNLPSRPW